MVDKYEYVYGMYDIKVDKEYHPNGEYVSTMHVAPGNIAQVALVTNEFHPTFVDSNGDTINKVDCADPLRRTSIEYYVTCKDIPGAADWIPILPTGITEINNEMLHPTSPLTSY